MDNTKILISLDGNAILSFTKKPLISLKGYINSKNRFLAEVTFKIFKHEWTRPALQ